MARKSGSTILQEELYPPYAGNSHPNSTREELDDARLVDLDVAEESPFLRAQKRVSARRSSLPKKTVNLLLWGCVAVGILGMAGAVQYGTARSLRLNFNEQEILGKTGTCSHEGTRYGWFASYANTSVGRVVVVVFLQGGRPTFGPKAAEIAGRMYRNMYDHNFFVAGHGTPSDEATVKTVTTNP